MRATRPSRPVVEEQLKKNIERVVLYIGKDDEYHVIIWKLHKQ